MSDETERFYGCRHPAWPDPLMFITRALAQAWYDQHKAAHPDIFVKRERVVADIVLGGSDTPADQPDKDVQR